MKTTKKPSAKPATTAKATKTATPTKAPKTPAGQTEVIISKFKEFDMFSIVDSAKYAANPNDEKAVLFRFGKKKASLLGNHLEALKEFADA